MMRKRIVPAALLLLAALPLFGAGKTTPPDEVVRETAQKVLGTIRDNKSKFSGNPQAVFDLVQKDMAPHFDFDYAARLVLGRAWRNANDKQRHDFIQAFEHYLVNSYANSLVKYADTKVEVKPFRGSASDKRAIIHSTLSLPDGKPINVDYAMVRRGDEWKAFDVSAEGVSYVMSYRNTFASEVEQRGLDELIQRLEQKAKVKGEEARKKATGGGDGGS